MPLGRTRKQRTSTKILSQQDIQKYFQENFNADNDTYESYIDDYNDYEDICAESVPTKGTENKQEKSYRRIDYKDLVFINKIGVGSFGSVWQGQWRGREVAIKRIHEMYEDEVEDFEREASMMELLSNHPHTVSFVGACLQPLCLVSRFLKNGSLADLIRPKDKGKKVEFSLKEKVRMLFEAASGVLHLHCEGVIHRDLALRNILVDENYKVCVSDFGFSRIKDKDADYGRTNSSTGPLKWMSPEAISKKIYSEKSDSYSFGVVTWELITEKIPYEELDLNPLQIALEVIQNGLTPTIPDTHPVLQKLMRECWDRDPKLRPSFTVLTSQLQTLHSSM